MMSLLAGIKFISKGERQSQPIESSVSKKKASESSSIEKVVEEKAKKDKKKHKKEHKEKKHKRKHHRDSSSDSSSDDEPPIKPAKEVDESRGSYLSQWKQEHNLTAYDSEFSSEADINEIAEDLRKEEAHENSSRKRFRSPSPVDNRHLDAHQKLKSMISSLKGNSNADISQDTSGGAVNNQSAAAMLRARLRTGGTAAGPNTASSSTNNKMPNSLEVQRSMLLLRAEQKKSQMPTHPSAASKDGEGASIKSLMNREKYSKDEDLDNIYAQNVMRLGGKFKGKDMANDKAGMDEEAPIDMKMYQSKESDPLEAMKRQAAAAIKTQQRMQRTVQNCKLCGAHSGQYVLSQSEHAVLRIKCAPYHLHELHLELVPKQHASSFLQCDEETQREMVRYQDCVQRMLESMGWGMLLLETAVHLQQQPHACIDIVAFKADMLTDISMCFREAFLSCDEEWSQHRKIITLNAAKPLPRAVPPHFPYLAIQWALPEQALEGLAHAVEEDHRIQAHFCYDVLAGALEEDNHKMRRTAPVARDLEASRLANAKHSWDIYDWTHYVDMEEMAMP